MLKSIKQIFSNENLTRTLKKYYKEDIRINKLQPNDILSYILQYSHIGCTQKFSSKTINYITNKNISHNAYYEQSKKYKNSFYKDILLQLNNVYIKCTDDTKSINHIIKNRLNNLFYDQDLIELSDDNIYLLVDGSCSSSYKNNSLHTSTPLYIYDYNHSICIDTYLKNKLYKKPKKKEKTIKLTKTGKERKNISKVIRIMKLICSWIT